MNPYDHYWRKKDGSVYSSRREREFPADDPEYLAWLVKENRPYEYPVDTYGKENRDWMLQILKPFGLRIYPLTEAEEYDEKILRQTRLVAVEAGCLTRELANSVDGGKSVLGAATWERLEGYAAERAKSRRVER
jgi:hypothetical protein